MLRYLLVIWQKLCSQLGCSIWVPITIYKQKRGFSFYLHIVSHIYMIVYRWCQWTYWCDLGHIALRSTEDSWVWEQLISYASVPNTRDWCKRGPVSLLRYNLELYIHTHSLLWENIMPILLLQHYMSLQDSFTLLPFASWATSVFWKYKFNLRIC